VSKKKPSLFKVEQKVAVCCENSKPISKQGCIPHDHCTGPKFVKESEVKR
jgi:hypothetical protein